MMRKKKKKGSPESPDTDLDIEGTQDDSEEDPVEVQPESDPEPEPVLVPDSPAALAPEPLPEDATQEVRPVVSLAVFLKVAGPKWDQLAGFKRFATNEKLGPLTIPEWRAALTEFKNKPVG